MCVCVYGCVCVCVCVRVRVCVHVRVLLLMFMLLFTVEQRKEPIPLKNFSEHVANMHKDRDLGFEEEYSVSCITL